MLRGGQSDQVGVRVAPAGGQRVDRGGQAIFVIAARQNQAAQRCDRRRADACQRGYHRAAHRPARVGEPLDERAHAGRALLRQAIDLAHLVGVVARE
jgi:hypothetical protein